MSYQFSKNGWKSCPLTIDKPTFVIFLIMSSWVVKRKGNGTSHIIIQKCMLCSSNVPHKKGGHAWIFCIWTESVRDGNYKYHFKNFQNRGDKFEVGNFPCPSLYVGHFLRLCTTRPSMGMFSKVLLPTMECSLGWTLCLLPFE